MNEIIGTTLAIAIAAILYITLANINLQSNKNITTRIISDQMTDLLDGLATAVRHGYTPCTGVIDPSVFNASISTNISATTTRLYQTLTNSQFNKSYSIGCYTPDANTQRAMVWTTGGSALNPLLMQQIRNGLGANAVGMYPINTTINSSVSTGTNLIGDHWNLADFTPTGMNIGDVAVFVDIPIVPVSVYIPHQLTIASSTSYMTSPFTVPANITHLYISGCAGGGGGGGAFTAQDSGGIMSGMGGLAGGHGQCTIDYTVPVTPGDQISFVNTFPSASGGTSGGMGLDGTIETITSGSAGQGVLLTDYNPTSGLSTPLFCLAGGFGGGTFTSSAIQSGFPSWMYSLFEPIAATINVDTTCQNTSGGVHPGIDSLLNTNQVASSTVVKSTQSIITVPKAQLMPAPVQPHTIFNLTGTEGTAGFLNGTMPAIIADGRILFCTWSPSNNSGAGGIYLLTPNAIGGYVESTVYTFPSPNIVTDASGCQGLNSDSQGNIWGFGMPAYTSGGVLINNGLLFTLTPSGSSYTYHISTITPNGSAVTVNSPVADIYGNVFFFYLDGHIQEIVNSGGTYSSIAFNNPYTNGETMSMAITVNNIGTTTGASSIGLPDQPKGSIFFATLKNYWVLSNNNGVYTIIESTQPPMPITPASAMIDSSNSNAVYGWGYGWTGQSCPPHLASCKYTDNLTNGMTVTQIPYGPIASFGYGAIAPNSSQFAAVLPPVGTLSPFGWHFTGELIDTYGMIFLETPYSGINGSANALSYPLIELLYVFNGTNGLLPYVLVNDLYGGTYGSTISGGPLFNSTTCTPPHNGLPVGSQCGYGVIYAFHQNAVLNTQGTTNPASVSAFAGYVPAERPASHECANPLEETSPNNVYEFPNGHPTWVTVPCHGNGGIGARIFLPLIATPQGHNFGGYSVSNFFGQNNENLSIEDNIGQSGSPGFLEIDW